MKTTTKTIINKKEKGTVKIRGRYYKESECAIDTFTKEMELQSKLTPYIALDNKLAFTSSPIKIQLNGKQLDLCSTIVDKYSLELVRDTNVSNLTSLFSKNNYKRKYNPSNKIYNLTHYKKPLVAYSNIENGLEFLNKYTFGFELETAYSSLDENYSSNYGFACLYDGSISGPELVSTIMKYNNFHHLHRFLQIIKRFSSISDQCSFHIHIGNVNYSEKTLFALYNLFQRLQDELNGLIAPFRKDFMYLANKGKDHSKNLPRLPLDNLDNLYELLGISKLVKRGGDILEDYIENNRKWDILGRYYNVNFLNYICKKPESKTVEIRSMQMTYNFDYIMTWLFINTAIINYAENNIDKILNRQDKIQLKDCIEAFVPERFQKTLFNNIALLNSFYHDNYFIKQNHLKDLESLEISLESLLKPYKIYNDLEYNNSILKILNGLNYKLLEPYKKVEKFDITKMNCYNKKYTYNGNIYEYLVTQETNDIEIAAKKTAYVSKHCKHLYSITGGNNFSNINMGCLNRDFRSLTYYFTVENNFLVYFEPKTKNELAYTLASKEYNELSSLKAMSVYYECRKLFDADCDINIDHEILVADKYCIVRRVASDLFLLDNQYLIAISMTDIEKYIIKNNINLESNYTIGLHFNFDPSQNAFSIYYEKYYESINMESPISSKKKGPGLYDFISSAPFETANTGGIRILSSYDLDRYRTGINSIGRLEEVPIPTEDLSDKDEEENHEDDEF